jgi:PAS domain S-box-containing protein
MFITDRDGIIDYVNPAFEASTGYSAPEAIGQTPSILKSGRQDESVYEDLWDTITSGEVWEGELTNETKSGILYQVELTVVPITDDTGTITHFAAIEQDVTDKLLREQTLNVLNRILRHNLRTAITVIEGQTDILESDLEHTDPRMVIETIQSQTESMRKIADKTAMIRTLWEQNREGKAWNRSYIESLVQQYCNQYPQADITLTVDISDEVQLPNAELFELAFDEAIENAVTHAEQTTPEIEITVTQKETSKRAVITVADNGPGIPENERETLEAGKEVPLAHGTGIGLWIMEWVTTNLGGEFVIKDNTPQGTLLRFDLPIVTHRESTVAEESSKQGHDSP